MTAGARRYTTRIDVDGATAVFHGGEPATPETIEAFKELVRAAAAALRDTFPDELLAGDDRLGACRSCGARVAWIRQPLSGRTPPFDVLEDEPGRFVFVRNMLTGRPMSHFATCPQSAAWRGKGRRG